MHPKPVCFTQKDWAHFQETCFRCSKVNEGNAILNIVSFEDAGKITAKVNTFQQFMTQKKL
jgi:hypothetical protein